MWWACKDGGAADGHFREHRWAALGSTAMHLEPKYFVDFSARNMNGTPVPGIKEPGSRLQVPARVLGSLIHFPAMYKAGFPALGLQDPALGTASIDGHFTRSRLIQGGAGIPARNCGQA